MDIRGPEVQVRVVRFVRMQAVIALAVVMMVRLAKDERANHVYY